MQMAYRSQRSRLCNEIIGGKLTKKIFYFILHRASVFNRYKIIVKKNASYLIFYNQKDRAKEKKKKTKIETLTCKKIDLSFVN